ncbi:MAG: DUF4623 domain-containing protein, partial [Ignavibacteria bacterium]|nr:DUF4623 domain-containing protein [Ignavibacteria bacterium]
GANALRYMEIEGRKYLAVFAYGTGNENLRMVDISKGMMSASLIATTPSLGTIANPNGAGDVSFTNHNDGTATLYVLGTNNGAGSYLFNPPKDVSTPSFNPGPGNYFESITVNITVSTSDAKIYYTTDNSDPDTSSTLYNKPIKINKSTIFKAIAFADGMNPSKIGSATYIIPTSKRLYSIWGKTQADKNFPRYFSTQNYERGMDVGIFNGKPRVVVVGRWLGPKVIMFDPIFGDSLSTILPDATIAGGTFPINFPGLSADGILFVGNMTIDVASSPFKVYRYDNETDPAKTVINYTDPALVGGRVGDMISVFGKASDNTLTIFAGVAQQNKIVKFSTSDKGLTFTPTTITLQNANIGTVPNITFATATTFYIKSYGKPVYYYDINGTLLVSIPTTVISSDVTNIKLIERSGKKYLLCYHPNDGGLLTDERMTVVEVTTPGVTSWVYHTDSIGEFPNLNATGAVGYYKVNEDEIFYIMGTNNGLAAFSLKPVLVSVEDNYESIPQEFMLEQNYPNPFNPSTIIKFTLKTDASVKLTIYNLLGEEVSSLLNSELRAGIHSVSFKPISLAGGVYFYRLEVLGVDGSKFMSVKKLIYLK